MAESSGGDPATYEVPVPRNSGKSLANAMNAESETRAGTALADRAARLESTSTEPVRAKPIDVMKGKKSDYAWARIAQQPSPDKPPLPPKPAALENSHTYEYMESGPPPTQSSPPPPLPPKPAIRSPPLSVKPRPSRPAALPASVLSSSHTPPAPRRIGIATKGSNVDVSPNRVSRSRRGRMPRPLSMYDQLEGESSDSDEEEVSEQSPAVIPQTPCLDVVQSENQNQTPQLFSRSPSKRRKNHETVMIKKDVINETSPLKTVCLSDTTETIEATEEDLKPIPPPFETRARLGTQSTDMKKPKQKSRNINSDSGSAERSHLEKCGFLMKQSRKTWKTRWCTVRLNKFSTYIDEKADESGQAPLQSVDLDAFVRVLRGKDKRQFTLESPRGTQSYSTESVEETQAWVSAISEKVANLQIAQSKSAMLSGWLTKVRNGYSKKRWCALIGRSLYYAKDPYSKPLGSINVMHAMVQTDVTDSDDEDDDSQDKKPSKCFSVTTRRGMHYFIAESERRYKRWTFFMHLAAGKVPDEECTPTEKVLKGLMASNENGEINIDGVPLDHSVLRCSKDMLVSPLTTLPSDEAEELAMELDKLIHMFSSVAIKKQAIVYHLRLAQDIIRRTNEQPAVYNEVYCQLIRNTNHHPYPNSAIALQRWQLLVLLIPICLPTSFFLTYLKEHLRRHAKEGCPAQNIATYGLASLQATLRKGPRKNPPSMPEIMTVLDRTLSQTTRHLMSIKVQLSTGSEYIVGFSPSSTCRDVCDAISVGLMMRRSSRSGFSLFANDPRNPDSDASYSLQPSTLLCDAMWEWEKIHFEVSVGRVDILSMPKLSFRRRLYFKENKCDDEVENILLAYQISHDITTGKFQVPDEAAIPKIVATLCQLEWGNYDDLDDNQGTPSQIVRFVPHSHQIYWLAERGQKHDGKALFKMGEERKKLVDEIVVQWRKLEEALAWTLGTAYINATKSWSLYGARKFFGMVYGTKVDIVIAVHEKGLTVLSKESLDPVDSVSYYDLKSFGSSRLVPKNANLQTNVSGLLELHKKDDLDVKIHFPEYGQEIEAALMMASYINAIVRRDGICSPAASINYLGSGQELGSYPSETDSSI